MHFSPPVAVLSGGSVVDSLLIVTPIVGFCVLCFVVRYLVSILVSNHLDGEERAGCFALFVLLVYRDCCVALPHNATAQLAIYMGPLWAPIWGCNWAPHGSHMSWPM